MKKITLFFVFFFLCLNLFSEGKKNKNFKVNFENDEGGNFVIENQTSADLILYAGDPDFDILLGGIRGNSIRSVNLSKINMPKKGCFLLRAATLEMYIQKQGRLVKGNDSDRLNIVDGDFVFSALVVFSEGDESRVLIPKIIDVKKDYCIYVSNLSKYCVLELEVLVHMGGWQVVAALAPMESFRKIFVCPDTDGFSYEIRPSFIYVNPDTAEKLVYLGGPTDCEIVIPEPVGGRMMSYEFSETKASFDNRETAKPMRLFFE